MVNFWKIFNEDRWIKILNLVVIIFILFLPYYIFEGKLYLGGDDSKLMYSYPFEFLKNLSFFSWSRFSSVSGNDFPQFRIPFLLAASVIEITVKNRLFLNYLIFSLPLAVGFISFQYMVRGFFKDSHKMESVIGGLLYIFSPIILVNQLANFYSAVWLLPLIPITIYFLTKYLRTSNVIYILLNIIFCTFFSFGLASIPWVLGVLFPVIISLLFLQIFFKNVREYLKKIIIFFFFLTLSQSYWLLPFMFAAFNSQKNNLGEKILAYSYNGFSQTVFSTATGTIIYPLLNLFHRQIAFDYQWPLKNIFINYYDKIFIFNVVFVLIIFFGIFNFKSYLSFKEKRIFLLVLIIFIISLFLFTVNIGPLENVFLFLGNIPGFVMFRNFYDKFALAFNTFYSILLTFSLVMIGRKFLRYRVIIFILVFILVIINMIPIKEIINHSLWTTKNINTNVILSKEYLNFASKLEKEIQPTSNILSLPFNSGSHAFIKEDNSNNSYVGTSPLIVFTGINDFSGDLSFHSQDTARFNEYLDKGDFKSLNKFFNEFNINYVLNTKNIPTEIKNSYLLTNKDLKKQGQKFISSITDKKIIESEKGNYELYSVKNQQPLLLLNNIRYERISPIAYKIYINNLSGKKELVFKDAFNDGWKLYLDNYKKPCQSLKIYTGNIGECASKNTFLDGNEIKYLITQSVFEKSHNTYGVYGNKWILDADYLKNKIDKKYYTVNKDGSVNFDLTLYFYPQLYFYIGLVISCATFIAMLLLVYKKKNI